MKHPKFNSKVLTSSIFGILIFANAGCGLSKEQNAPVSSSQAQSSESIYGKWLVGFSESPDGAIQVLSYKVESQKLSLTVQCLYRNGSAPLSVEVTAPVAILENQIQIQERVMNEVTSSDGGQICRAELPKESIDYQITGSIASFDVITSTGERSLFSARKEK